MLNSRDISLLRTDVAANCRLWIDRCKAQGLNVLVTNTVRDAAYQESLYAKGRTAPGSIVTNSKVPTFHSDTAGLAFDFCKNKKGQEYSDTAFFREAAAIAKEMGFSWGGDWKSFVDMPHIQWDHHGKWSSNMILAGKLPPDMPLWKTAAEPEPPKTQEISKPQNNPNNEEEENMIRYHAVSECPSWAQDTINKLITKGYLSGDGQGLDLSHDMIRLLVVQDRAGAFDIN